MKGYFDSIFKSIAGATAGVLFCPAREIFSFYSWFPKYTF